MSDYTPNHLLANVLLRLPFDSLLQSRCVSKSWRSLIDSSGFIKMHLKKVHEEANSCNGIKFVALNQNKFYNLDLNLEANDSSSTKVISVRKLNCSLDYSRSDVRLIGSCNGLLCLLHPNTDKVVLWIPWIQKSWELPSFPVEYRSIHGITAFLLGFGYDCVNDDYKVLNRIQFSDHESSRKDEVYVYSSKLNSWRRMGNLPMRHSGYKAANCIHANGALHWFMRDSGLNGVNYIISCDLSSEEFRDIACPRYPDNFIHQNLKVLNGCLCLMPYYKAGGRYVADLWVMEEYGVEKSWTKLTRVTMPSGSKFRILKPLALSKNKRELVLLMEKEKLVFHDLETGCLIDLAIVGDESCCFESSCTCIGSLVKPFGAD